MKARFATTLALVFVVASVACAGASGTLGTEFSIDDLRAWCAEGRNQEDVKREFGADPMTTASLEEVPGEEDVYVADTIRFTYGIDELPDSRLRRAPISLERPGLIFRFRGDSLIEVAIFYPLTERPSQTLWEQKKTEQNKAVDPTPGNAPRNSGGFP